MMVLREARCFSSAMEPGGACSKVSAASRIWRASDTNESVCDIVLLDGEIQVILRSESFAKSCDHAVFVTR